MNVPGPARGGSPTGTGNPMKNGASSKLTQNPHAVRELREKNLEVAIGRIAFYDHPLFSREDRLYAELRIIYSQYRAVLDKGRHVYLAQR